MRALLGIALVLLGDATAAQAAQCPGLDLSGMKRLVASREQTKVVFFASWCVECAAHLREEQPPGTLLVATFDEQAAAEDVATKLGVKAACYLDAGVAEAFGIKAVPAVVTLGPRGQVIK